MADAIATFKVYLNAMSFRAASNALASPEVSAGVDKLLVYWPTVVCEAFSLELFLKCLHAIRLIPPQKKHDVADLYNALQATDKETITRYYDEIVQLHFQHHLAIQHGLSLEIDQVLQRASDAFIKVRYWHEGILPSADASGKISNAGIGSLCDALRRFIDELHPEWQTMEIAIPVLMENLAPPT